MGTVTLSFDNGPDPAVTPAVLEVLGRRRVRATFFVLGRQLDSPASIAIARRASDEGHWIGNHSFTHKIPLGEDPAADAPAREIGETERRIGALADPRRLFRPFGGGGRIGPHLLSAAAVEYLTANDYTCVLWNSVPRDWIDHDAWVERALADCAARPHTLVVLHDVVAQAMRHLDRFVGALLDAGHRIAQEFPRECVPIERGEIVADLAPFVTAHPAPRAGA